MKQLRLLLVSIAALWSLHAVAVIETYQFSSPDLEQRYHVLSQELRCPKCQNQNIADSNAPISQDLRKLLYEQLEAGSSDEEILDHMVARYGEFVRYRPRFSGATAILWLAPVLLLLAGILVAFLALRSRRERVGSASAELSDEEQQRLKELLQESDSEQKP
jgi:cytochrome c-type biogenesis protein CcmH